MLVGVPDWDTLIHLDEEGAGDVERVQAELNTLLIKEAPSLDDEPRILELLAQLEHFGRPLIREVSPGMWAFRRALALRRMGKFGPALVEADEAKRASPDDESVLFVYLDLLRIENLPSAVAEAERIARRPTAPALLLVGCINVLASQADLAAGDEFPSIAERVLGLCRRLDRNPDRDQAGEALLALSEFNRGIVFLRAGRITQATNAFRRAQQTCPFRTVFDSATALQTYDRHAGEVARSVRMIAEQWTPPTPVAA